MQYLILPLNKAQLTAGYKNPSYKNKFGFRHYGIDLSNDANDDRTLWAMGTGVVKAVGLDNVFGNVVVVVYKNCYIHATGKTQDLTVRLYHMASTSVKVGQTVTTATKLGVMGNTGKYTTGAHVHVEIDTDTQMPTYAPGLAGNSNIIKKGVDTTLSPSDVLYIKPTAPDKQTLVFAAGKYADRDEADLPIYPEGDSGKYIIEVGPLTKGQVEVLKIDLKGYNISVKEA